MGYVIFYGLSMIFPRVKTRGYKMLRAHGSLKPLQSHRLDSIVTVDFNPRIFPRVKTHGYKMLRAHGSLKPLQSHRLGSIVTVDFNPRIFDSNLIIN